MRIGKPIRYSLNYMETYREYAETAYSQHNCEEATELSEADIDILDDRLRGQLSNPNLFYQMTFTFNPVSSRHWIKSKYFDVVHEDIFTHQSTYLENRFIDDAYHRRMMMRKERDPDGYRIYGLGDWGEVGGLIFNNWEVREISQDVDDYEYLSNGQDFGLINIAHLRSDTYVKHGELLNRCS